MAFGKSTDTPSWKIYNRPWYLKLLYAIGGYFQSVGLLLWSVIKSIPRKLWQLLCGIGHCFQGLWFRFIKGDWRTKTSYFIMGFGNFSRGPSQFLKGFLWFAVEALFIVFMIFIGAPNLAKFGTLGTELEHMNANGDVIEGDHSLKILIYSVMTLMLLVFFVVMYIKYTKVAYQTQKQVEEGKKLPSVKRQINYVLNDGYHVTVLLLPVLGILIITVLPLLCNILIAFTNYDYSHFPPAGLFTWTGFDAFVSLFAKTYGSIIWNVLGWTLVWAVFATFTNFFFGMFLAMMINKKTIKLKAFWRICFIIVIAVPDFVSLLMMSRFFGYSADATTTGPFNLILQQWFGIDGVNIDWLSQAPEHAKQYMLPRVMVIIINLWRGMPFTMLATSGILMNIPEDLYESCRIDGAGPVRRFVSITFPYIMFVMGPQLITTFTGNINNFNVIFFLTGGGPNFLEPIGVEVGHTDLLVTWLYRMSVSNANKQYNLGAVIGLFTFVITAFFALIVFNSSKSIKQEDTFQ